ncbi:acyltransferase domain-containing protein [Cryptosporidium serpentis]
MKSLVYFFSATYGIILTLSVVWCLLSFMEYRKYNPEKLSCAEERSKFYSYERLDYGRVCFSHLFIGAIIYSPFRIMIFMVCTIFTLFILLFLNILDKLLPVNSLWIYKYVHSLIIRFIGCFTLYVFGATKIFHYSILLENGNDNTLFYKVKTTKNPPPTDKVVTIVSNHISMLDISFFLKYISCNFVARNEIRKSPIFSLVADTIGCIYVDRNCAKTRKYTRKVICNQQRLRFSFINKINKVGYLSHSDILKFNTSFCSTKSVQRHFIYKYELPLVIFPEGTTSNGSDIIPFKVGAFESLLPIQPVVLLYKSSFVSPAYDILPFWVLLSLLLCNTGTITISAFWLPHTNPANNDKSPTSVYKFSEDVRSIMSYILKSLNNIDLTLNKEYILMVPYTHLYSSKLKHHVERLHIEDSNYVQSKLTSKIRSGLSQDLSENTSSFRLKHEYIRKLKDS